MTVADPVLGLEVIHDLHMLLEPTISNDLLPLGDWSAVLGLNGREVRRRPLFRPWRRIFSHGLFLLLTDASGVSTITLRSSWQLVRMAQFHLLLFGIKFGFDRDEFFE